MRPSYCYLKSIERRSPRSKCISFIGLGRMGSEMAFNLFSKKFTQADSEDAKFVVCDAVPDSAKSFSQNFLRHFPEAHITVVMTPEEAVRSSGTIVTMLPSSPQVRTVYSESGGIISTLRSLPKEDSRNTLCIDSTTLDVDVARSVALDVIQAGAHMTDAPVSGGVMGAKAGSLSFLVGGTTYNFGISRPFLALMGSRIIHCGPSGAGLAAKICNNLILGVEQIVVAEAMLLGQKLGLDPAVLAGVINSSTGGCWSSSVNNPVPSSLSEHSPPCERGYDGGFATALMLKDMGLATVIGTTSGSPLPLAGAAEHIYAQAIKKQPDLAGKDFSSVYLFLQRMADEGKRVKLENP